jgi:hypothetical protein
MAAPRVRVPSVAVEIHITPSFVADFGELEESKVVYDQLVNALEALRDQERQDTLPIARYGIYGDTFQYTLNADLAFTFKRVTDRDSEGQPILSHYFLKNFFRLKL